MSGATSIVLLSIVRSVSVCLKPPASFLRLDCALATHATQMVMGIDKACMLQQFSVLAVAVRHTEPSRRRCLGHDACVSAFGSLLRSSLGLDV